MKELRFGIEIEVIGISKTKAVAAVATALATTGGIGQVTMTDGRVWRVVSDASLSGGQDASAEVVSPILTYADLPILRAVIQALASAGARVDNTCGIHVHVDGARFNARALARLVTIIYRQENLIQRALRIRDRRLGSYCKPVDWYFARQVAEMKQPTMEAMNEAWFGRPNFSPTHYDPTRYHGLNLQSFWYRGTIEFRWFEGSVDANTAISYVQFALSLCAKALDGKRSVAGRREYSDESARYDFRVFLLGLGMIGREFAAARRILALHLPGDSAWKSKEQRAR